MSVKRSPAEKLKLAQHLTDVLPEYLHHPHGGGTMGPLSRALGVKKIGRSISPAGTTLKRAERLLEACELLEARGWSREQIKDLVSEPAVTVTDLVLSGALDEEIDRRAGRTQSADSELNGLIFDS